MKSSLPQARGIACGLAFILVLIGFGARSTAANQPGMTADATSAPANTTISYPDLPAATERPLELALAEPVAPAEPVARLAALAPVEQPRTAAPVLPPPAQFFTINQVLAKQKLAGTRSPSVQMAAIDPTGPNAPAAKIPPVRGDEPFGLFTFRAPEGLLWVKWRKVQADMQAEAPILARCRADHTQCTPAAARFAAIVKEAEAQHGRAKVELVNRQINAAIRYTSDMAQWGQPDLWSTPLSSLATGLGDCEDYAIAKYEALRLAGVAMKDLRILLVRDTTVRMGHAVLAVRHEGRWLVLDNRWTALRESDDIRVFVPLFAINEDGVKLFAAPYARQPDDGQAVVAGAAPGAPVTMTIPANAAGDGGFGSAKPLLM